MIRSLRALGGAEARALAVARVLLVDDDPASRLTLRTVLEAGGYQVDAVASASEAVAKLDQQEYELVLSDVQRESPESGLKVLAHARLMDYKPATAVITAYHDGKSQNWKTSSSTVLIEPEDLPELLSQVASLISERATRRVERELRHATNS